MGKDEVPAIATQMNVADEPSRQTSATVSTDLEIPSASKSDEPDFGTLSSKGDKWGRKRLFEDAIRNCTVVA